MRLHLFAFTCATILAVSILSGIPLATVQSAQAVPYSQHPTPASESHPLVFVENVGQFAPQARFQARTDRYTLWLTEDALWITLLQIEGPLLDNTDPTTGPALIAKPSPNTPVHGVNLKLSFLGANPHPQMVPFGRPDATVSYLRGNDSAQWQTNVPVWGGVRYIDLYPGIDLEISGPNGQVRPRLICQSGCPASLQQVRLQVEGASDLALGSPPYVVGGDLRFTTALGEWALPLLAVEGAVPDSQPAILDLGDGAFELSAPFTPLPTLPRSPQDNPADLLYSTFLGGMGWDEGRGIAVDGAGNAYVTGYTNSTDFPVTPGAFDTTLGEYSDVSVAKLNADGSDLDYATFLGGNYFEEGYAIAVDAAGRACVTGYTHSTDFPTTPDAYDTTCGTDATAISDPVSPPTPLWSSSTLTARTWSTAPFWGQARATLVTASSWTVAAMPTLLGAPAPSTFPPHRAPMTLARMAGTTSLWPG